MKTDKPGFAVDDALGDGRVESRQRWKSSGGLGRPPISAPRNGDGGLVTALTPIRPGGAPPAGRPPISD